MDPKFVLQDGAIQSTVYKINSPVILLLEGLSGPSTRQRFRPARLVIVTSMESVLGSHLETENVASGRKRELITEIAERDSKKICNPEITRSFSSIEDAVDRLLPYHLLDTEDPLEVDAREAQALGSQLLVTRHDAWLAQATRRAGEMQRKTFHYMEKISQLEKEALQRSSIPSLMLQNYALQDISATITAENKRREDEKKAAEEKARAEEERVAAAEEAERKRQIESQQDAEEKAAKTDETLPPASAAGAVPAALEVDPTAVAATETVIPVEHVPEKKEDIRSKLLASFEKKMKVRR